MDKQVICMDDLLDVAEMAKKLEHHINATLKENESRLGISALMASTINCIVSQCDTLEEVAFCRNVFIQLFDSTISCIKVKNSS